MDDPQLLRYSRQILLPQIGIEGQQRLLDARVLVIGVGGLGSPVSTYLSASGVGQLTLVDPDRVELTNLQRQPIHTTETLGVPKVESARKMIAALNPGVQVDVLARRLDDTELLDAARNHDVIVDCSDNFPTRFAVNRAGVETRTPLVSGAVVRFEGQVSVFRADRPDSPCYACLYRDTGSNEGDLCSQFGVLAPVVGIIGTIQATETIKLLLGLGDTLTGRVLALDAISMEFRIIRLRKDPACPVCAHAGGAAAK
jgi:molybdopterin/thiamine biosynthesis adenylyltransferase